MELAAPGARRRFGQFDRRVVLASGCALVALAAAGAAVGIAGAAGDAALGASARGLIVGVPIAVGLSVSARSQNGRFGLLLAVLGAVLLVATLGELHDDLAYSIGRIAGWVAELLLIYLLLSFPTGRLSGETDRVLVSAAVLIVLTAF